MTQELKPIPDLQFIIPIPEHGYIACRDAEGNVYNLVEYLNSLAKKVNSLTDNQK